MPNLVKADENGVRTKRTNRARERFLQVLGESCNISEACRSAGIGRTMAYAWRADDPDFAAEWAIAEQKAFDRLEKEAWRRGVDGVDKPVVHKGEITDTYKEYSDRMLELLLKAHRPEKFKDRWEGQLTGKNGGPIQTEDVGDKELARRLALVLARGAHSTPESDDSGSEPQE